MGSRRICTGVLLLVALAGCSSDPPLGTRPPVSPAPSVAPSPVISIPSGLPSEAAAPTSQGASAFARYFYGQVVQAFTARDPDPIAALSAPGCKACEAYVASLTRLRDMNERVDFDLDVVAAVSPKADNPSTAIVTVIYNSKGSVFYGADGKEFAREPARRNAELSVTVRRAGTSWQVVEVVSE